MIKLPILLSVCVFAGLVGCGAPGASTDSAESTGEQSSAVATGSYVCLHVDHNSCITGHGINRSITIGPRDGAERIVLDPVAGTGAYAMKAAGTNHCITAVTGDHIDAQECRFPDTFQLWKSSQGGIKSAASSQQNKPWMCTQGIASGLQVFLCSPVEGDYWHWDFVG